ncbi:MAG TPA: hypothetical protein VNL35_16780 [Chloroflexota bacterium]|nr:hypothetical protein [Chloroflexota bacterium]
MGEPELCLYWLNPAAWDALEVEIVQAIALESWLNIRRDYGYQVAILTEDARITGGLGDGGQVIAVDTPSRQFFIAPPAVIPYLADLLPPEDYQALLDRTPAAALVASSTTALKRVLE